MHLARTGAGVGELVLEVDEMENVERPDANVSGEAGQHFQGCSGWRMDLAGVGGRDAGRRGGTGCVLV